MRIKGVIILFFNFLLSSSYSFSQEKKCLEILADSEMINNLGSPNDNHCVCFYEGNKYKIIKDYIINSPKLIRDILRSVSIDSPEEKQSYFNLIPLMSDSKMYKFSAILEKERIKILEIERNSWKRKIEIKKKYLAKWENMSRDKISKDLFPKLACDDNQFLHIAYKRHDTAGNFNYYDMDIVNKIYSQDKLINVSQFNSLISGNSKRSKYNRETFKEYLNLINSYPSSFESKYNIDRKYFIDLWNYCISFFYTQGSDLNDFSDFIDFKLFNYTKNELHKKRYLYSKLDRLFDSKEYEKVKEFIYDNLYFFSDKPNMYFTMHTLYLNGFLSCEELESFVLGLNLKSIYNLDKEISLSDINSRNTIVIGSQDIILDYIINTSCSDKLKNKFSAYKLTLEKGILDQRLYMNKWYSSVSKIWENDFEDIKINMESVDGHPFVENLFINQSNSDAKKAALYEFLTYFLLKKEDVSDPVKLYILKFLEKEFQKKEIKNVYRYMEKHIVEYMLSRYNKTNKIISIGVSDYKNLKNYSKDSYASSLYDLKYSHKDAGDIKEVVTNKFGLNWDSELLINEKANKSKVTKAIYNSLTQDNLEFLIIYFSGHGQMDKFEDTYLLPYDYDDSDFLNSSIKLSSILELIEKSKIKHILFIADACHSGSSGFKKGKTDIISMERSQVSNQKIYIYSSLSKQASEESEKYNQSVFTHYLIKGLKGEAKEIKHDGFVSLHEIIEYLNLKFSNNMNQTPGYKILNSDSEAFDLPLSKRY